MLGGQRAHLVVREGDSDAHRQVEIDVADAEATGQRSTGTFRDFDGADAVRDGVGDHEELVAAQAGDLVVGPERLGQSRAAGHQELVTHVLSEHVVDVGEVVDVDDECGHVATRFRLPAEGASEVVEHRRSVREPGQRIVRRQPVQLGEFGLRTGDVVQQERDLARSVRRIDARRGAQDHLAARRRSMIDPPVPGRVPATEHVGGQLVEE